MEMWDHRPHSRHRRDSPSFSSSLLDAIYRSIDESDGTAAGAPDPFPKPIKKASPPVVTRPNYRPSSSSSSYSSSSSSYSSSSSSAGGFSSDADSAPRRPKPIRTDRILTRSDRIQPEVAKPEPKPKQPASIKKKLQDLKKTTSPKLAGFLNSLFNSASSHKKPKLTPASTSPSPSPSSSSRSCLSKTPSTRGSSDGKRSVRFCPVGVILGEDCRPVGEKMVLDGEMTAVGERERKMKAMMREMIRGFEGEIESEEESDGSEDLFELENLGGFCGKFSDELPVYETTDLGRNCAIATGCVNV